MNYLKEKDGVGIFEMCDNRDIRFCYWCGARNKISNYKRDSKLIKRTNGSVCYFYYCPKCLR